MEQKIKETQMGLIDSPFGTKWREVQRMNMNADTLFTITKDLTPAQGQSVRNYLVGWLCGIATEEQWHEALAMARKAVVR